MKNKIKYVVKKGKGYMPSKEMKKIANISDKNIYKKAEKNPVKFSYSIILDI